MKKNSSTTNNFVYRVRLMNSSFAAIRERAAILNELEYHGLAHRSENGGRLLDKAGNDHSDLLCTSDAETRARIDALRRPLMVLLKRESEEWLQYDLLATPSVVEPAADESAHPLPPVRA
jgi:hypothetical protein